MRLACALLVTSMSACSSSTPSAATSDGATATAGPGLPEAPSPPPAPPPPSTPPDVVGTWTSASCGARTYERVLELRGDGSFVAHDRVSPCAPGVQCVWSGIVTREGTWSVAGDRLALAVAADGAGPRASALPASFALAGGAPVEETTGATCTYERR
jgi:hypothetical protein